MNALIAAAFALLASAPSQQTLPLSPVVSGHYTVEVTLGENGPYPFILDTGASHTAVAEPLAETLGFVSTRTALDNVQSLTTRFEAERFMLRDLRVGTIQAEQMNAVVIPVAPETELASVGLLGADAFADRRIRIDFTTLTLDLDAPQTAYRDGVIDETSQLLIGYGRARGMRSEFHVMIDTGAARTMVNTALAVRESRPLARIHLGMYSLGGVDGSEKEQTDFVDLRRVRIGGRCVRRLPALKNDLDVFRALGWEDQPAMILGMDFLAGAVLTIDRTRGTFQLESGPSPGCQPRDRVQRETSGLSPSDWRRD
ncbi:MAG: aspartyl protease family protein [Pseudomonadota bacterium]